MLRHGASRNPLPSGTLQEGEEVYRWHGSKKKASVSYSNWRRSSNGLASRMDRFRPDLALTLLPGCSLVPASFVKRKCSKREPPKQVQIGRSLSSQQVGKSQLTGYPPYPRKTRLARFY